jgi:tRNA-dihydrouridine synthase
MPKFKHAQFNSIFQETGVQGVMSAEGHLTNPALFAGISPPVWKVSFEYLDLVDIYPCPLSYVRGHLFKLLHHLLQIKDNFDLREIIARSSSVADFRDVVNKLQERYQVTYHKTFFLCHWLSGKISCCRSLNLYRLNLRRYQHTSNKLI